MDLRAEAAKGSKEAKRILQEGEREIGDDPGTCPFCGTENYIGDSTEFDGDSVWCTCYCEDCESKFRESFVLKYQDWEVV